MSLQISQPADQNLQAEFDRLTYSAYLLTLDPGVAFSVAMRAIDGSIEHSTADPDLFERTVELSLQQLRGESSARWDGESSAFDAVLYGQSTATNSPAVQSLNDLSGNPILLLDSTSRVAFVLHHLLGYTIHQAAVKAQVSEKQYRKELRKAYLQLASCQLDHESPSSHDAGESALA
jgi:DNA-directed RNA polymerase specialized sigma24 family protein